MKTIASLTIIYLPSTFAASIFSTGFFSYDSQDGTGLVRVNPQIWKMFAIASALSVVTIAVWIYLNKKGPPRIFDWARQLPKQETNDALPAATMPYVASGGLGVSDKAVLREDRALETGMSLPKISLPVPIDGDMA
jgi:hypothetical protein